jgi:hypothetical protein
VSALAELLDQAADELRHRPSVEDLRVAADKLAGIVALLRRAGDAHGVPVGPDVLTGLDALQAWPWRLPDRPAPPSRPGDRALVLATLLDHAARELGGTAAAETVALGAGKTAELLAVWRAAAQRQHLPGPAQLDGLIRGLGAFALGLAARCQQQRQPHRNGKDAAAGHGRLGLGGWA